MKKMKRIGIVLLVAIVGFIIVGLASTTAVIYEQQPDLDTASYNKDPACEKQRPFIVDKAEYPFKSNWYERDGIAMHYIDEGKGIPVVLTHGNPDWSFLNRNIIKALSGECRLIAYDLPGFGFSDTPPNFKYTPQEHVEWISALIFDHLKLDKFILVVQDWGGPTGLEVATQNPDAIYGVVISNTWAWKPEGSVKAFSNLMKLPGMKRLILNRNFFAEKLMIDSLNDESKNNKAIIDAYRMPFPTPESRLGTAVFPVQITVASSWLEELEGRLPTLADKPVELIFGLKDFTLGTPAVIARWQAHFPDAPITKLPEANHFTQEDSPESFETSIRNILRQVEARN